MSIALSLAGAPGGSVDTAKRHADRGLRLAQAGDLKGAEAELRLAVHLSPNDPDYLADLGGILGMQQRLVEAGRYFEKALKIHPGNLVVRRDLAANQWQIGQLAEVFNSMVESLRKLAGQILEVTGSVSSAAAEITPHDWAIESIRHSALTADPSGVPSSK